MYQLTENGVLRLEDNAWIPDCPDNRDWQAYLKWREEGNSPLPIPLPPLPNYAAGNGQERKNRIQRQQSKKQQALQARINRYVLERM